MEIYWAVSSTESILTSLCHADHHWLEFWGVKRHLKIWEKHRITLNRCVDASTNDWIDGSSPQKKGLADRSREKTNSEKPFCPLWSCSAACPSAAPPPPRPRAACEKVQKGPVEPVAHWYAALPSAGPWATRPSDTTWLPTWDRDARMQTFTHTHIYIFLFTHTYIYMYIYMCVYMWKKFVLREEVHQQAACYDHANNFLLKFHKSRAITADMFLQNGYSKILVVPFAKTCVLLGSYQQLPVQNLYRTMTRLRRQHGTWLLHRLWAYL